MTNRHADQRDTSTQGVLRGTRHRIAFVQDDQLEGGLARREGASGGEHFDLFPHNGDSTLVAGIQFQYRAGPLAAKNVVGQGEGRAGFARARRPIEQQMWKTSLAHKPPHWPST